MSVDPADYVNKSVLIIGRGNAAFEAADNVSGVAAHTHMVGRSGQRFAWQTHYVGDLRAINNNVLDTYQLKSQTAIADNYDMNEQTPGSEKYFMRVRQPFFLPSEKSFGKRSSKFGAKRRL